MSRENDSKWNISTGAISRKLLVYIYSEIFEKPEKGFGSRPDTLLAKNRAWLIDPLVFGFVEEPLVTPALSFPENYKEQRIAAAHR